MGRRLLLLCVAVSFGGCPFDPTLQGGIDGAGRRDAGLDGNRDALPRDAAGGQEAGCAVGEIRCEDGIQEVCEAPGQWKEEARCPLGCRPDRHACAELAASNGIDAVGWTGSEEDVVVAGRVALDTDTGGVLQGQLRGSFRFATVPAVAPCGGQGTKPRIGVFVARSLHVLPGAVLRFVGRSPVALLLEGEVVIEGLVDVSAGPEACPADWPGDWPEAACPGPGGFRGGLGAGGPEDGLGPGGGKAGENGGDLGDEAGGGGAGHGGTGGDGGDALATGLESKKEGGQGGGAYGDGSGEPLCGGSGGGGGGPGGGKDSPSFETSHGGGGGGAVQVVSRSALRIRCASGDPCGIRATGAGGMGDHESSYDDGGGGGGSGGTILLEAPSVVVGAGAVLSVAGGGGGGGRGGDSASGDGDSGPFGPGRAGGGSGEAAGGSGGGGDELDGSPGQDVDDGGGGGGGAAGWIVVRCFGTPACFELQGTLNPSLGSRTVVVQEVRLR